MLTKEKEMERITLSSSCANDITILVVDDDTTCLSIVAALLKKFRYEVVTVKHPNDALCTLRIKEFDLVVSDVHMPDMNGFELQQAIAQEFNLPVVLMSADDEEGVALKGLERGAAFFILKPVCADDLRDLWQFATMKKTSSQVVIEESSEKKYSGESGAASGNEASDQTVNKESKRKSPRKEGSDEKGGDNASTKKPKVIWTNSLHNRFLEAIRSIGLDRAVPKKILEVMNVPGLTRENVASHLQKYRIFLRRVSDASFKIQYSAEKGLGRNIMRSSNCESSSRIITPSSPLTLISSFNQNQFGNDAHSFPNLETCNITQSGFGQSRLLSINRGWSWPRPNTPRLAQNDFHTPHPFANISLEDVLSTNFDAFPDQLPSQNKTNYVGYSLSNIQNLTNLGGDDQIIQMPNDMNNNNNINNNNIYVENQCVGGLLEDVINNGMVMMPSDPPLISGDDQIHFDSSLTPIFDLAELDIMSTANQQPLDQLEQELGPFLQHDQLNIPILNQQKNGSETSTNDNFYDDLSHWDNSVLSFDHSPNQHQNSQGLMNSHQGFGSSCHLNETVDVLPINEQSQVYGELSSSPAFGTSSSQLSKTILPLTERDDDEFLEYLLAPFGEDQTPEGLI